MHIQLQVQDHTRIMQSINGVPSTGFAIIGEMRFII
jgi:hypothetical protein